VHEREIVEDWFSYADDHHSTTPSNSVAGGAYTTLNACAFKYRPWILVLRAPEEFSCKRGIAFSTQRSVNEARDATWNKLSSEF
jgi:hypothetical protein